MASPAVDWSVPAPLRTLYWWPGVAFLLLASIDDVSLAVGLTMASGFALVAVGLLAPPLARRLTRAARRAAAEASTVAGIEPVQAPAPGPVSRAA